MCFYRQKIIVLLTSLKPCRNGAQIAFSNGWMNHSTNPFMAGGEEADVSIWCHFLKKQLELFYVNWAIVTQGWSRSSCSWALLLSLFPDLCTESSDYFGHLLHLKIWQSRWNGIKLFILQPVSEKRQGLCLMFCTELARWHMLPLPTTRCAQPATEWSAVPKASLLCTCCGCHSPWRGHFFLDVEDTALCL